VTGNPEVIGSFVGLVPKNALLIEVCENTCTRLCHNCDTKAALTAKTDFVDTLRLLILRKLLKSKGLSGQSGLHGALARIQLRQPTNPAQRRSRAIFAHSLHCT
jgi:hypothetical protein